MTDYPGSSNQTKDGTGQLRVVMYQCITIASYFTVFILTQR